MSKDITENDRYRFVGVGTFEVVEDYENGYVRICWKSGKEQTERKNKISRLIEQDDIYHIENEIRNISA